MSIIIAYKRQMHITVEKIYIITDAHI